MSVGDLLMGWLLLRQSAVAIAALDAGASGSDRSFYEGKIAGRRSSPRTSCRCCPASARSSVVETVDNG